MAGNKLVPPSLLPSNPSLPLNLPLSFHLLLARHSVLLAHLLLAQCAAAFEEECKASGGEIWGGGRSGQRKRFLFKDTCLYLHLCTGSTVDRPAAGAHGGA